MTNTNTKQVITHLRQAAEQFSLTADILEGIFAWHERSTRSIQSLADRLVDPRPHIQPTG